MVKKGGVYIIIAIITVGLILAVQYSKPKEVNWFPSYVAQHKIPLGTYVANELLTSYFGDKVKQVQQPPFEFLTNNTDAKGTYLLVNDKINFGDAEMNALLSWVSKGNTLVVASGGFEPQLLDTLNLDQISLYSGDALDPLYYHQLVNPVIKSSPAVYDKDYYTLYFNELDTLNTSIVGEVHAKSDDLTAADRKVTVVRQKFGSGEILLSQFPEAFTNYFILKGDNRDYTSGLFSYLKTDNTLYVDNHHKSGKSFFTSPMYIFLNTKEFKWAYYMVLIGAVVYIIFEGKRKQRAIPVVTPLKNQTLAFTKTIADMYYETGQQKEIAKHKVAQFLDYIRTRFYLNTEELDQAFFHSLASRSNHTTEEIKGLFQFLEQIGSQQQLSDSQLQVLNKKIEEFKAKVDGK